MNPSRNVVLALALVTVVGCGAPQFSNREEMQELIPPAQEFVQQVLDNHFGSVTEMVAWERLPLTMHLAEGKVAEAIDEREIRVDIAEPHGEITAGLEFLAFGDEVEVGVIRDWDEESHVLTSTSAPATPITAGGRVIVGPGKMLERGRMLYAEHCLHCHGVTGDGNGSTAKYMTPRPRDYRKGIFKFTSTDANSRIQRDDLARVIENGIPGTYMPSFKLLEEEESEAIIEYVLWLSMRGELEYQLTRFFASDYATAAVQDRMQSGESYREIVAEFNERLEGGEIEEEAEIFVEAMISKWQSSWEERAVVKPEESRVPYSPESIARGRELYLSKDLNCIACHGEAGYGNGPQTYSITKNLVTGEDNPEPGLYDEWGNPIKPRNLHRGIFRGGRRPLDVYRRVHAGIKGTPMPAFGAKLKDEQIWDLVNYVYSVPFEEERAGSGADESVAAVSEKADGAGE